MDIWSVLLYSCISSMKIANAVTITQLSEHIQLSQPLSTGIFENIIRQYNEYVFVFHFDQDSVEGFDISVGYCLNLIPQYYLKLYGSNMDFKRPCVDKIVNIIFLSDPATYEGYEYNFRSVDVNIFLIKKFTYSYFELWKKPGIKQTAALFILDIVEDTFFSYSYYYGVPQTLKKIDFEPGIPNLIGLHNDFQDFYGNNFSIYYLNYPPFFIRRCSSGACVNYGAESMILNAISEKLNFTYNLKRYSEVAHGGAWHAMVEGVGRREVDWAMGGISISLERILATDTTRHLKTQRFSVLFAPSITFWAAFENVLFLLQWEVGLLIIISMSMIALVSEMIIKRTKRYGDYLELVCRSLVDQACNNMSLLQNGKLRMLFLSWWLVTLCLTAMIKSRLTSRIIQPRLEEPESIEDLLDSNYRFQVNKQDWSVLRENLVLSHDPKYREVLRRVTDDLTLCDAVQLMTNEKVAFIDERDTLGYDIFEFCSERFPEEVSKLKLLKNHLFSEGFHTWMMQKSTPLREPFSNLIGRLDDAGLISHWYTAPATNILPKSENHMEQEAPEVQKLSFVKVTPFLAVYCIGISLSIVVFLLEILYKVVNK